MRLRTPLAILCDRVSAVLGVRILRIVKVTGKDPTYRMELGSSTVHFSNISKAYRPEEFSFRDREFSGPLYCESQAQGVGKAGPDHVGCTYDR